MMARDFFGEMALLHDTPRSATVVAVTPCSLCELQKKDLDRLIQIYPVL